MKFQVSLILVLICFYGCKNKNYPKIAPKTTVTALYHNQKGNDSYRYMENLKDSIFLSWVKEQETHTKEALN
jgi:hypothetical protein